MNHQPLAPRHARATSTRFALSLTAAAALAALSSAAAAQEAAKSETQLETVTVTGVRASLTKSLANKRTNDQVVESVVAEDIGKLPDNNVVEALQRVTGIQVTNRAGGEVGTLSIRGLPDVATTWNGRNIFTASGTQVALQDIPSTLVRRSTSTRRATPASWRTASLARSTSSRCAPSTSRARSSRCWPARPISTPPRSGIRN